MPVPAPHPQGCDVEVTGAVLNPPLPPTVGFLAAPWPTQPRPQPGQLINGPVEEQSEALHAPLSLPSGCLLEGKTELRASQVPLCGKQMAVSASHNQVSTLPVSSC